MPIPLALPLIAGGAAAVQAIPSLIRTPAERENTRRLRELEAAGSALGLTPAERAELTAAFRGPLEATQRAGEDQTARALAAYGTGGAGSALALGAAARDQQLQAEREAAGQIAAIDAQRRTELEQEREDRRAFRSQAIQQRVGALASIPAAALMGGQQAIAQRALLGPAQAPALQGPTAASALDRSVRLASLSPPDRQRLWELAIARGLDTSDFPPPPTREELAAYGTPVGG